MLDTDLVTLEEIFPVLDAPTLRPDGMFSFPTMFNFGICGRICRPYIGEEDREIGTIRFWTELNRALDCLKGEDNLYTFPIAH